VNENHPDWFDGYAGDIGYEVHELLISELVDGSVGWSPSASPHGRRHARAPKCW
jgi:hypothetical protein